MSAGTYSTGYKVLRPAGGRLVSCSVKLSRRKTYSESDWTRPSKGCGPLCVFGTRQEAMVFQRKPCPADLVGCVVRECLYEPSRETRVWFGGDWGRRNNCLNQCSQPYGTRLAVKVRLKP
ncbi:MAG: hypothetical protein WCP55_13815, partial [Lentisphaerota bacterium]